MTQEEQNQPDYNLLKAGAAASIALAGAMGLVGVINMIEGDTQKEINDNLKKLETTRNTEERITRDRMGLLINNLEGVQTITKERIIEKPLAEPQIGNVVGNPQPDKYIVIGKDANGREIRAYLSVDGKVVEEYFR